MKKYTQYRPLFFMALLGFNTLSACIGTRQELGVRNRRYERDYMEGNLMGMWNSLPGSTKGCIKVVGAGVVCVGILGGYRLYHFTTPSNAVGLNMNNGTIPFNFTAIPLSDMSALNKTVTQAIEKGNQTWGDGSSTELPLSSTTIEDPITTVKSTTSTEQPSSTTTAQPDDGVPPVKDSMVIDDEIMEYLDANNFSKKSMQELFEKGLNKDAKEVTNSTLLMKVAVRPDKDEARVKFLIDQGVDVNQQDERGDTVLHMLSRRGWEHIIKLFPGVKDKINPNLQDTYKRTVLHEAIIHGCFKNTAEWLLQIKGIDINIKDKDGKTPLDLAKEKDEGDCDIIQELLNNYNRH